MRVLVTGANGNLGRRLIAGLRPNADIRAVVRSARAAVTLERRFGSDIDIEIVDYGDAAALAPLVAECDYLVHLVGIIRETRANSYEQAHEAACRAVVAACRDMPLKGILHVGVLGAAPASTNACFASRGKAEEILRSASCPVRVVRVPMVLGEGDHAAAALRRQALSPVVFTFRKRSREQPIYAGDVVAALATSMRTGFDAGILELAGPESLTRESLIRRAGRVLSRRPRVVSLPISLGMTVASLFGFMENPPITPAMLEVLDHDDDIDPSPACEKLGLILTSLDDMLMWTVGAPFESADPTDAI